MQEASSVQPSSKEDKENVNMPINMGSAAKTPSKLRVSLGTPANFYFKYMNSSRKAAQPNAPLDESKILDEDNLTGTISIPGLNRSVNLADTSLLSLGASSSGSSEGDIDLLNRSTLSDTTDLTASSFVLQATSRQVMRQMLASSTKKRQQGANAGVQAEKAPVPSQPAEEEAQRVHVSAPNESSSSQNNPSYDTPVENIKAPPSESLRRTSPSLRQRMSATPQSLKKLTEDLRNQRIQRQAKHDAMRRLSVESKNSIQSLNTQLENLTQPDASERSTLYRKRLPPQFTVPVAKVTGTDDGGEDRTFSASSEDPSNTTHSQFIKESMDNNPSTLQQESPPPATHEHEESETSKQGQTMNEPTNTPVSVPRSIGISLQSSPASRKNLSLQNGDEQTGNSKQGEIPNDPTNIPTSVPRSIGFSLHSSPGSQTNSPLHSGDPGICEDSFNSPSSKITVASIVRTPRPTPTKLRSTPRRIVNPKALDSPARHTRSKTRKNRMSHEIDDDRHVKHRRTSYDSLLDVSTVEGGSHMQDTPHSEDESEKSDRDILEHEDSTTPNDEGDTASLEDLLSVFGDRATTEVREEKQQSNATVNSYPTTPLIEKEHDRSVSDEADSSIIDQLKSSGDRIERKTSDGPRSNLKITIPLKSGLVDVSRTGGDFTMQEMPQPTDESETSDHDIDDTASLGDLLSVFGNRANTVVRGEKLQSNMIVNSNPTTPVDEKQHSHPASDGVDSRIIDQLKSSGDRIERRTSDGPRSNIQITIPLKSGLVDVSRNEEDSPMQEMPHSNDESETSDHDMLEHDDSTTPNDEGDTASLGDLLSVFGNRANTEVRGEKLQSNTIVSSNPTTPVIENEHGRPASDGTDSSIIDQLKSSGDRIERRTSDGPRSNIQITIPLKSGLVDVSRYEEDSPMQEMPQPTDESETSDHDMLEHDDATTPNDEGDTASLGDLLSVFGNRANTEVRGENQQSNTIVNSNPTTPVIENEHGRPASDGTDSSIIDQLKSSGDRIERRTSDGPRSNIQITNPLKSVLLDASTVEGGSVMQDTPHSEDESEKSVHNILEHDDATTPNDEDDTASLGDLLSVFGNRASSGEKEKQQRLNTIVASTPIDGPNSPINFGTDGQDINHPKLSAPLADWVKKASGDSHFPPQRRKDENTPNSSETSSQSKLIGKVDQSGPGLNTKEETFTRSPTQSEGDTASLGDISGSFYGGQSKASRSSGVMDQSSCSSPSSRSSKSSQSVGNTWSPMSGTGPFAHAESTDDCGAGSVQTGFSHLESNIDLVEKGKPDNNRPGVQSSATQEVTTVFLTSADAVRPMESLHVIADVKHGAHLVADISTKNVPVLSGEIKSSNYEVQSMQRQSAANESQGTPSPKKDDAHDVVIAPKSSSSKSKNSSFSLMSRKRSRSPYLVEGAKEHELSQRPLDSLTPGQHPFKSPFRTTPNRLKKLTPSKLSSSPGRVLNPYNMNSPAKNTRSSRRPAVLEPRNDEAAIQSQISVSEDEQGAMSLFHDPTDAFTTESSRSGSEPLGERSQKRKSSFQRIPSSLEHVENNTQTSPVRRNFQPIGILSSRKKKGTRSALKPSQRSVAFGSPEAAEYHVESPSVSMTPMPPSKAKALFVIPKSNSLRDDSSISIDKDDRTVEIEADLNILVDKITVENMKESPQLSPISKGRDGTGPVILPGAYDLGKKQLALLAQLTPAESCEASTICSNEIGETVELEIGMEGLISNMLSSTKQTPFSEAKHARQSLDSSRANFPVRAGLSPAESSVEMTDAQSIASLNSAKTEKFTSRLELSAQKLDFGLNRSSDSAETADGQTVELESDMTSLLAAAGVRQSLLETRKDMSADRQWSEVNAENKADVIENIPDVLTPVSTRSRRTSIVSSRFTLDSDDRFQITAYESNHAADPTFVDERSVSFHLETSEIAPHSFVEESLNLSLEELLRLTNISKEELRPRFRSELCDSLVLFNTSTKDVSLPASVRWHQFIQAVCVEVERRTDAGSSASDVLSSIFHSDPHRFNDLQRKVRSEDWGRLQEILSRLVKESQKVISFEWDTWLATVMESFDNPLKEVLTDLAGDTGPWNTISVEYGNALEKTSLITNKKSQKARRKSFTRRKSTVRKLEDEIRTLESLIAETSSLLNEAVEKERESELSRITEVKVKASREDFKLAQSMAESSQKCYMSLKGLHSWNLLYVDKSRIQMALIGQSRQSCITLDFKFEAPKPVTSFTRAQVPAAMKRSLQIYRGSVAAFVDHTVHCLSEKILDKTLDETSVPLHIQNVTWSTGRLDVVAIELQSLLNRYNGKLYTNQARSFLITFEFEGRRAKLGVEFEIGASYPSLPIDVRMDVWEGCIDLEDIRRTLIKNARPGFGYLSRACDIVNAFVEES